MLKSFGVDYRSLLSFGVGKIVILCTQRILMQYKCTIHREMHAEYLFGWIITIKYTNKMESTCYEKNEFKLLNHEQLVNHIDQMANIIICVNW